MGPDGVLVDESVERAIDNQAAIRGRKPTRRFAPPQPEGDPEVEGDRGGETFDAGLEGEVEATATKTGSELEQALVARVEEALHELEQRSAQGEHARRLEISNGLREEGERAAARAAKELDVHAEELAKQADRQRAEIEGRVGQALGALLRDEIERFSENAEKGRNEIERRVGDALGSRLLEGLAKLGAEARDELAQYTKSLERDAAARAKESERERRQEIERWLEATAEKTRAKAAKELDKQAGTLAKDNKRQRKEIEGRIGQALSAHLRGEVEKLAKDAEKGRGEIERRVGEAMEARLREEAAALSSAGENRLGERAEALGREAETRAKQNEQERREEMAAWLETEAESTRAKAAQTLDEHAEELAKQGERQRTEAAKELDEHAEELARQSERQRSELEGRIGQALSARLREEITAAHAELQARLADVRQAAERAGAEAEGRVSDEAELLHAEARHLLGETEVIGEQLRELSEALIARHTQELLGKPIEPGAVKDVADDAPIDLNRATAEELRGLSLSLTQTKRLLEAREARGGFGSLEEIEGLPGFGARLVAELKDRMKIGNGKNGKKRKSARPPRQD